MTVAIVVLYTQIICGYTYSINYILFRTDCQWKKTTQTRKNLAHSVRSVYTKHRCRMTNAGAGLFRRMRHYLIAPTARKHTTQTDANWVDPRCYRRRCRCRLSLHSECVGRKIRQCVEWHEITITRCV